MVEIVPNSGDRQAAVRLQQVVDVVLAELTDYPTAQDMEKLFTIADWRFVTKQKGLILSADECEVIIPGKGVLRGHHVVERSMIEQHLNSRWGFTLGEGEAPLKVLTQSEHFGAGMDSLHNKMWFEWKPDTTGKGVLHPSRLLEFQDPQSMMNELIDFYLENYPELAKATRGYLLKNNVPFTH